MVTRSTGPLDIGVYGARGIPSTYSGYETFLTVLLPELARRGHGVTMYCRRGEVSARDCYQGVRCVHLPAVRTKQLSTLTHGWVAAARARLGRHDVVFVVNVANTPPCLVARALGERIVLNTDGQEWKRSKWGPVARTVFLGSAQLARWAASGLVADSMGMRDVYRSRFRARSTVIPYCWTGIEPGPSAALADLGVQPRNYFVVAGRLNPENNVDAIAAAYLEHSLAIPLVVLGTANYRSPVRQRLERLGRDDPRLVIAGHVGDRGLFARVVTDALAYLHGHSVGGINPALVEAMGCGARILALDTTFNREALGDTGDYFASPAEVGPLVRAVLAEPERVNEAKREAARARARQHFSLEAVADAYEALFRTVARESAWSQHELATRWLMNDVG